MTKEEFDKIILPLWLMDDKKQRDFLINSLTGNFDNWEKEKNTCSCGKKLHITTYCDVCDNDD